MLLTVVRRSMGRLPCRSERAPVKGDIRNCSRENSDPIRPENGWACEWACFSCIVTILLLIDYSMPKCWTPNDLRRRWNQWIVPPNRTVLYFFSRGIPTASLNQSTTLCRDWYTASCIKATNTEKIQHHGGESKHEQWGQFSMSQHTETAHEC